MTHWKFMGSAALVALIAGNAALADVTPEQVWQNWQNLSASYGQAITASSAERSGDTLLVRGVSVTAEQDGMSVAVNVGEVAFTDIGDGSVNITMSDQYPVDMIFPPAQGDTEPTGAKLTISHPGLVMRASGSDIETRYDYTVPTLSMVVSEIQGVDADKVNLTAAFGLTGMTGNYIITGTGDRALSSSVAADGLSLNVAATDPEGGGKFTMTAAMADLAGNSTGKLIAGVDLTDMAAALRAGFATDATFSYGQTDYSLDFADATQTMASKGSVAGGDFSVAMDKTRLAYGAGSRDVAITVSGSDIPFPEVVVKFAESAFDILMPVSKSDTVADFSMLTKLVDLTISDDVWSMFDPMANLPRDPVTVVFDAKGTGKLSVDLLDPDAMQSLGDTAPGEVNSIEVTDLTVKAVGAALTGSGAATFDNTDLVSYDGLPAPTGRFDVKVVGANGLMDKLVQMGLLPEDQLMGFRMMLGMFAKGVEGEVDTMVSVLEFKDKGFFANGMQLK
ncbi:MAG: hypothetical protein Q8P60_10220 [Pseudorhodobacter sp.]|nr:hypothetical protein [Pseudorhodobacter sp.]